MAWFEELTGIEEQSPEQVGRELAVADGMIVCPNGRLLCFGTLETPRLSELRQSVDAVGRRAGRSAISEIVADARKLHEDPANENALFQVASQFNLLEMSHPSVKPEQGVGIYELDHTQGPACAMACGAGTIYRNYFVPLGDAFGQSSDHQIDCSSDLGHRFGNTEERLWSMQNGYLFPTDDGLELISKRLHTCSDDELGQLRGELRIGLQWQTDVTLPGAAHQVSQAYCSALPIAYARQPQEQWTGFANLILDAAYEATLCAAVLNAERTGVNLVYLTLLGGGVFGNRTAWIVDAIERAFRKFSNTALDIRVVSHRRSQYDIAQLIEKLQASEPS